MKVVGFWYAETKRGKWILVATLIYTFTAVIFALAVVWVDLYYIWGNLYDVAEIVAAIIPVISGIVKLSIATTRRSELINLIVFSEKNFWNAKHDSFGQRVLRECEKRSIIVLCGMAFCVEGTVISYLMKPLFDNQKLNGTDRALPFRLYVDLPLTVTPYYEITYTIESLSTIYVGISFFCFDNLLSIFNLHVVAQFKILQHRLETLCDEYVSHVSDGQQVTEDPHEARNERYSEDIFGKNVILRTESDCAKSVIQKNYADPCKSVNDKLKACVKRHVFLFDYIERLENLFSWMLFCQIGVSSCIICFAGFETFLAGRRELIFHFTGSVLQTFIFTWTCNEISLESGKVGEAAFRSKWYLMPISEARRSLHSSLMLIVIRSRRNSCLTAGKFHKISSQTFKKIMNTNLSYLSVLRKQIEGT
ncbi:odorant receptor 49b-like [Diprion similis]|uniref:odorant receptor 49b-like n=1 Tax=Diprion similis TaxID=362088 RepID=UPI001EF8BD20|nr:odorant receptor 49b-like [Diprion similis]